MQLKHKRYGKGTIKTNRREYKITRNRVGGVFVRVESIGQSNGTNRTNKGGAISPATKQRRYDDILFG